MNEKGIFNSIFASVSTIVTCLWGGWDICLMVLVTFIALDYITGLMGAFINKNVSSEIGFVGIFRKATIFIVLIVAVMLDRLLNEGTWVFRTLVCYFYIANEAISLLENAAKIGVPIPQKLMNVLVQLKNKQEDVEKESEAS